MLTKFVITCICTENWQISSTVHGSTWLYDLYTYILYTTSMNLNVPLVNHVIVVGKRWCRLCLRSSLDVPINAAAYNY